MLPAIATMALARNEPLFLPPRGRERVAQCGGHADRGRSADRKRADRLGHLGSRAAHELDRLLREQALVEEDDAVPLEADDLPGGYVPSSHEDR